MSFLRLTALGCQSRTLIALAACSAAPLFAQVAPGDSTEQLDTFIVSATRTPQDPGSLSASVERLSLDTLKSVQVDGLQQALAQVPGVIVSNTGATGGLSSIFMRGLAGHHTLFVVDGVRMNDRSSPYTNYLGGAELAGLDRIEVLRGPQSTLYGSSAMGGVILMETSHGAGDWTGGVSALGGSDQTFGGNVYARGSQGPLAASLQLLRYQTENSLPRNAFEQWSGSGRLEYAITSKYTVGATFRVQENEYEEPGSRFFASDGTINHNNHLFTAYAEGKFDGGITSRLTLGAHDRHYVYKDSWGTSTLHNRRRILDWQTSWAKGRVAEVVAGVNLENSKYRINQAVESDRTEALFVSTLVRPVANMTLNAGARYDNFDTFGEAVTGRVGGAWTGIERTKLRASFGTGFSAPGVDDRYGVAAWGQLASPGLKAEKSRGWDIGFDHELGAANTRASVTYFRNDVRNLLEWQLVDPATYTGRVINRARARTEGGELAVSTDPLQGMRVRLAYTYLEARDDDTEARLIRRPRHTLDGQVAYSRIKAWEFGVGARVVAGRFEQGNLPSYTTARAFISYAPLDTLRLRLRAENALDRSYEDVLGYAALPRQIFGSVEWTF